MKAPRAPRIDERRTPEFLAEMEERARAWIPSWGLTDGEHDFGCALLEIAARFNSEVSERLDGAGEKMRRGFLDWLAVRGEAARPARMPVVFKLAETAREGVLASSPVRMQADAAGTPVVFETEAEVRIVPGRLEVVVGIDAEKDAFYLPPPGLNDLKPQEPLPTQWQLKSFAAAGMSNFQLDPEAGLLPDIIIESGDQQYRIVKADKDLVTIDRPLVNPLEGGSVVTKVTKFSPFDGHTYNQQQHALYLGDSELLNVVAEATIEVVGASALREGFVWEYWGKLGDEDEVEWQPLAFDTDKQASVNDAVVLTKPKGEIVEREIGGKKSRWLRAFTHTLSADTDPIHVEGFSLRINSSGCDPIACPFDGKVASPAAEGMANSTPLVLDNVFFPLGKEPRQFDAFYLGSKEAFSKTGAKAQLCFEMADPTFASLSAVHDGVFANKVLAGVGKDRALQLLAFNPTNGGIEKFREREPLQPPAPGFDGKVEPGNSVPLDSQPPWRLPVWTQATPDSGFLVAVPEGDTVWVWHEHAADANLAKSGWIKFGPIPADNPPAVDPIAGLVFLGGSPPKLVVLRQHLFATRDWNNVSQWQQQPTTKAGNPLLLEMIVPVLRETSTGFVTSIADGMVGVSATGLLHTVDTAGVCVQLSSTAVDLKVRPVAVVTASNALVVVSVKPTLCDIVIKHSALGEVTFSLPETDAKVIGLEVVTHLPPVGPAQQYFLASVKTDSSSYLAWWLPQSVLNGPITISTSTVSSAGDALAGIPTDIGNYVSIPGAKGDIYVSEFDLNRRFAFNATVKPGIVTPSTAPALGPNDIVTMTVASVPSPQTITAFGITRDGEAFYPISSAFPTGASGPLLAYQISAPLTGTATALNQLQLQLGDREATVGSFLFVDNVFHKITALVQVDPWVATISPSLATTGTKSYLRPVPTNGRTAPYMQLNSTNNNWDAALLERTPLTFPQAVPERQHAKAFSTDSLNHPLVVAMAQEFTTAPGTNPTFIVDAVTSAWSRIVGDTASNPELSWEYWNGTGWWKLNPIQDDTLNFKRTGVVTLTVPTDLRPTDWSGRTNHWIRARLIGGDYGHEEITVKIKSDGSGGTIQTVERSSKGIRAPSVLKLHISYSICGKGLPPAFVVAEDSGTLRDESDANRTQGAIVETFVPLALTLGRLTKKAVPVEVAEPTCPPECDCQTLHPKKTEALVASGTVTGATARVTGREVYIGLAATLSEAPVNVLLLVDEQKHTEFAPMSIEALAADRFVPIVADDATRALGESGVLSMTFAVPPTRSELFGKKDLTWLRLIPKQANDNWIPTLRGAYLNAAWASATETLTRELLGSSNGAPNLTVFLARPPLLRNTLELRVKEPLGDEEREELLKLDSQSVLSAVEGLPGDWVLWKQVIDPDDEVATARVYALDETSGDVRFGDGLHGKIPPIGRDSIVAFSYARTELDPTGGDSVPGNKISSRTVLNLVSPVETVESVISADQAAGGAPLESDDRVLRFGFARLRHRSRAVTQEDLVDLTLQSSPDIAQARAFVRRGYIRLVVVMRGKNPVPNAAQIRELRRLLLDAAPASLSAPNVLRIEGPGIRRLRIELKLLVESLDHAGQLSSSVKKKFEEFFDTATGGLDKDGWALGAIPSEEDIALALSDAPYLESIEDVKLHEVTEDGKELPSVAGPGEREIVMLADDPIRIQFETAEVMV
ncbi:MAG: hypothetical protein QOH71_468 [Blastocatellia bacterium]|jgi:hypothetical protein|nr:hypothetical protein [Blastocatellia bacterium]